MPGSRVEVDGLSDLRRALGKFEPEVRKEMNQALRRLGSTVAADAKRRAPVLTGTLRKSIGVQSDRHGVAIRAKAAHAKVHEFGGRHPVFGKDVRVSQPARPFLRPAVDANRARVLHEVEAMLAVIARRF